MKNNGHIEIAVYCGPHPSCKKNGITYPDKITSYYYDLLKRCGVNLIFGHREIVNTATEDKVYDALKIAEEVGIGYLVKDEITEEYCGLGLRGYKDYRKMSETEKAELDARFEKSILKYKDYPSFKGIICKDEPGSDMFEGISRCKKVFERVCPDKIFLVNLYPYYISSKQYQYGWSGAPWDGSEMYKPYVMPNIKRYEPYLNKYNDTVDSEIICYDAYPFVSLGECKHSIHTVLYELQQKFAKTAVEKRKEFWTCLQNGGRWCQDERIRITNVGEVNLEVSLAIGFGAKGLIIYPGCFPDIAIGDKMDHSGLLDEYGEITEQYPVFMYSFIQLKAIEKYIVNAEFKGIIVSGKYFGMLPGQSVIEKIQDNDCIYQGGLPETDSVEIKKYKELERVKASTQVFVSCFDNNGESVYLVINNSAYIATDAELTFCKEYEFEYIEKGVKNKVQGKSIKLYGIPAGENILVRIIK